MSNLIRLVLLFIDFKLIPKFYNFIFKLSILPFLFFQQRSLIIKLIQSHLQLFLYL